MRESIGGAMMLRIFLVVIVIFVVFLCVSANFARAFRVKNGVITIIEQYEGINDTSIGLVENYIKRMGYSCKKDMSEYEFDDHKPITNYVLKRTATKTSGDVEDFNYTDSNGKKIEGKIYNIQVCVNWNFPVIDAFGTWVFNDKTELIGDDEIVIEGDK